MRRFGKYSNNMLFFNNKIISIKEIFNSININTNNFLDTTQNDLTDNVLLYQKHQKPYLINLINFNLYSILNKIFNYLTIFYF